MPDDSEAPRPRQDPYGPLQQAFGAVRDAVAAIEAPSQDEVEGGGDWMLTYTGRRFRPLAPDPAEIRLADIAHALAMTCRYGGHCTRFYSVAEHSVLLAQYFHGIRDTGRLATVALLHDAAEAYLGDLVRPVKHDARLDGFVDVESRLTTAILRRYWVPLLFSSPAWARVMDADSRIIHDELAALFPHVPMSPGRPLGVPIEGWSPDMAESRFIEEARRLGLDTDT